MNTELLNHLLMFSLTWILVCWVMLFILFLFVEGYNNDCDEDKKITIKFTIPRLLMVLVVILSPVSGYFIFLLYQLFNVLNS